MNSELPFALIIGIEHFAAKKLAEEVSSKDINVVGVGDYVSGLNEIKNFSYVSSLEEVEGYFNYVFDFNGEIEAWNQKVIESEKISLICINNKIKAENLNKELKKTNLNWRIIEAYGVYGPGMDDDEDNKETGFLVTALKQAVKNKNLTLPLANVKLRLLCVIDLVEAILRSSFLSGTEGEKFVLAGNEINSEKIASVLINEAKMTRFKVMQKDISQEEFDEEKILETQKKLRWQAKIDFDEGVKETLQYFFTKIDEEGRKKTVKVESKKNIWPVIEEERKTKKKVLEVVVDENLEESVANKNIESENNVPDTIITEDPELKIEVKNEEKLESKVENIFKPLSFEGDVDETETNQIVEEEMDDYEDYRIKNSNLRQIRTEDVSEVKEVELKKVDLVVKEKTEIKKNKFNKLKIKINSKIFTGIVFVFLMVLLIGPVSLGMAMYQVYKGIKEIPVLITERKYPEAEKLANKYLNRLKGIDDKIDEWSLNKLGFIRNYQTIVKAGEDVLGLEKNLVILAQSGDNINDAIFKNKAINWDSEIEVMSKNLNQVSSDIGVLQARLSGNWEWLPLRFKGDLQKKSSQLSRAKNYIDWTDKALKIMPEFLGLDGKKREYMVLLQNETELRPGGGFIGSYGLLSFQGGKLLSFDIKDVYEADGQLNGHVEPPEEIKSYLGEANFYMRDANWNPNFPSAAVDLQWFLDKETGKKVNGVIGVNLGVARAVLGAVGEVYVPDFKERISKDNLYEQAEFYAETKFFPGSIQKASFLGAVGKQLFDNIQNLKTEQKLGLVEALIDSLQNNNMQIALNNPETAKLVAELNWDGAIYQGKCGIEGCISDYLYIVEANLGVNKANYFLYRNIEEAINFSNQSLSRVLKINYENTAKNTNWPGGDYKNYIRIYLPMDTNLSEISLIDTNNPNLKKVYSQSELKIRELNGKKEIGFLVNVPVLSKRTVEIRYSTGIDISNKSKISYVNYIQKQPGFGETGLVTLISYPEEWQATQVQPKASLVGGKLLFNSRLDQDIKMGVELSK